MRPNPGIVVAVRSATLGQFAHISGAGERKLAAYGAAFLQVVRAHAAD